MACLRRKTLNLRKRIYGNFVPQCPDSQQTHRFVSEKEGSQFSSFEKKGGRKKRKKKGRREGRKEGRKQQSPISIISLSNELLVGACKYKNSPLTRCLHNVLHFI